MRIYSPALVLCVTCGRPIRLDLSGWRHIARMVGITDPSWHLPKPA